jgi:hypothetical protein
MVLQYFLWSQISLIRGQRVGPFHLLDLSVQNLTGFVVLIDGFEVLDKIWLFLLSFRTAHFFGKVILGLSEVDGFATFFDLFDDGFGTVFVKVFHGLVVYFAGVILFIYSVNIVIKTYWRLRWVIKLEIRIWKRFFFMFKFFGIC